MKAVTIWHLSNGLLLNTSKTEALVAATKAQVARFDNADGISIGDTTVEISTSIRVLGITIDQYLTFDDHITKVDSSCNYHIHSLRHIRHLIYRKTANTIACLVVIIKLDYCNAVLYGITGKNILRLQRVQNSLARVVCVASFHSPSALLLHSLHWLSIRHRITHKVATLTSKALHHRQPTYLYQLLNIYSQARQLPPSGAGLLVKTETLNKTSDPAFAIAAASTRNRLPSKVRTATTTEQFSVRHLFSLD